MDFGLGPLQHPCPILDFQAVLLLTSEGISQEKTNPEEHFLWVWSLALSALQKP